jgi:hypothetical protein
MLFYSYKWSRKVPVQDAFTEKASMVSIYPEDLAKRILNLNGTYWITS